MLVSFAVVVPAYAAEDADASKQAQDAAESSSTATTALTPERASSEASQSFDNPSPPAATPDGSAGADLQPKPFSASPNQ